jgi:hypothetical protein
METSGIAFGPPGVKVTDTRNKKMVSLNDIVIKHGMLQAI